MPVALGHRLTGGGQVVEVVRQMLGQLNFVKRKAVEIFLRRVPRHVRPVDANRQKQRLLMPLGQLLCGPRDNLGIGHCSVRDLQR